MPWPTTTFGAGYDWTLDTHIKAFWAALAERAAYKSFTDYPGGSFQTGTHSPPYDSFSAFQLPAIGDDVSCFSNNAAGTRPPVFYHPDRFFFPINQLQDDAANLCGAGYYNLDMNALVVAAGATAWTSTSPPDYYDVQDFRTRKRPARLNNPTDIAYDDDAGNPTVAGSPGSTVPKDGDTAYLNSTGEKWTRAAGVWSKSTDQSTPATTLIGWGTIRPGDYVGSWIWTELYALFHAMTGPGFVYN